MHKVSGKKTVEGMVERWLCLAGDHGLGIILRRFPMQQALEQGAGERTIPDHQAFIT